MMSPWRQVSEGLDPVIDCQLSVFWRLRLAGIEQILRLNECVFSGAGPVVEGAGLSFATMCHMIKSSSLWVAGV